MQLRSSPALVSLSLSLALLSLLGPTRALGDQFVNGGGRADFIDNSRAVPAKNSPDLLITSRVPDQFDPSTGAYPLGCLLQARAADGVSLVSGVRARYTAELIVLDLTTGTFTKSRVGAGKVKTGDPGRAFFTDVEASDFGDLPEEYVAIIQTRFRLKNKKPASALTAVCDASTRLDR